MTTHPYFLLIPFFSQHASPFHFSSSFPLIFYVLSFFSSLPFFSAFSLFSSPPISYASSVLQLPTPLSFLFPVFLELGLNHPKLVLDLGFLPLNRHFSLVFTAICLLLSLPLSSLAVIFDSHPITCSDLRVTI